MFLSNALCASLKPFSMCFLYFFYFNFLSWSLALLCVIYLHYCAHIQHRNNPLLNPYRYAFSLTIFMLFFYIFFVYLYELFYRKKKWKKRRHTLWLLMKLIRLLNLYTISLSSLFYYYRFIQPGKIFFMYI